MAGAPRTCCDGFTRAEAIRSAAAAGGPASAREWDPRMPVPAGAGVDRRRFLLGAGGGPLSVYGAGRLGLTSRVLGDGVAQAAALGPAPVLVSVFLAGGIDSLSMLAPVADPLVPQASADARGLALDVTAVRRGSASALASVGGVVRTAPRRRQADRLPGDRLHEPRHVALHLAGTTGRSGRPRHG